jgi:hypothetical protein
MESRKKVTKVKWHILSTNANYLIGKIMDLQYVYFYMPVKCTILSTKSTSQPSLEIINKTCCFLSPLCAPSNTHKTLKRFLLDLLICKACTNPQDIFKVY